MILTEGDLQIDVSNAADARKFDDPAVHGLTHCMKAVDFVFELDDRYLFIEFKDPQHPHARERDQNRFVRRFQTGQLDDDLKYKYRDSLLYEWALGRADKPIHYYVLVAADFLTGAELTVRTDQLKRQLPLRGPGAMNRKQAIVEECLVFNLESWNRAFPNYQVSRLSP